MHGHWCLHECVRQIFPSDSGQLTWTHCQQIDGGQSVNNLCWNSFDACWNEASPQCGVREPSAIDLAGNLMGCSFNGDTNRAFESVALLVDDDIRTFGYLNANDASYALAASGPVFVCQRDKDFID